MYPYIIAIDMAMMYISASAGTWYMTIGSESSIMQSRPTKPFLMAGEEYQHGKERGYYYWVGGRAAQSDMNAIDDQQRVYEVVALLYVDRNVLEPVEEERGGVVLPYYLLGDYRLYFPVCHPRLPSHSNQYIPLLN